MTTNLVTNPSVDVDTTGWSVTSATVSRYTTVTWLGSSSAKATWTNPTAALAGFCGVTVSGLTIGQTYTACLMAYRAISTYPVLQLVVNDGTNKYGTSTANFTKWELLTLTFTAAATTATVGVTNATAVSAASTTGLIDCVTVTQGTSTEPFCGATANTAGKTYTWTGAQHASTSVIKTGRTNQMRNPSFGDGTRFGWNGATIASTVTIDTAEGLFGSNCLKMVLSAGGSASLIKGTSGSGNTAEMNPVIPGQTYTVSGYIRSTASQTVRMDLTGANASGVLTAGYGTQGYVSTITAGAGAWTRFKNAVTVAAGDYFLVPTVQGGSWTSGATVYLDGFMIEEGGAGGNFFDGEYQNDWTVNAWSGTRYLSPSTQSFAPITSPTVKDVYTSSVQLGANPTISLPVVPAAGDTLILITSWSTSAANPPVSAVSGAGAAWTQIPGGMEYTTAWIGTGATASGTITATATATTNGRSLRVYRVSGVSADAVFKASDDQYPTLITPNQIAIGVGYMASADYTPLAQRPFPHLWADSTVVDYAFSDKKWNSGWLVPPGGEHLYVKGGNYGGIIIIGSPVANTHIARRNPLYNASVESTGGITASFMPSAVQTTTVYAGRAAYGGVSTNTPARAINAGGPTYGYAEIVPNKQYTLSCYVWCSAARTASIVPSWRNHGQSTITTVAHSYTAIPASTWTRITWTGTSYFNPTDYGAYYLSPEVAFTNVTGDTCYIDALQIDEGPAPLPFLDNSFSPAAGDFVAVSGNRYGPTQEAYTPERYSTMLLTPLPPPPTGPVIKVREAGAWVVKHPVAKARIAGAWVAKPLRYWNGTAWVNLF